MKLVIAAVCLIGFGAVAGALWVGHHLAEPTVVADPYEAGLHYDDAHHQRDAAAVGARAAPSCDLAQGPCARAVDGATVVLEISPRPIRAMTEVTFTVDARRGALPVSDQVVEVGLSMPGMYMGANRVRLAALGGGRYQGRGAIVRCPSGKRAWSAVVSFAAREPRTSAPIRAEFTFDVAE